MRTLQWVSDNGKYILFCDTAAYILSSPVRSDVGANAQIFIAPGLDGATTYGASLNQRTFSVEFLFSPKGNTGLLLKDVMDSGLDTLNTAFNPKISGWLIYRNERGGNVVRARPVATPTIMEQGRTFIKFSIEFMTDKAHWNDIKLHEITIGTLSKAWKFPFVFPMTFGSYSQYSVVNNPSSEPINPMFYVYSQLTWIKITNRTTGEYILVNHAILEHQYMVIDVENRTVTLYENGEPKEDVSNWVEGDWVTLIQGDNTIAVENDIPNELPAVVMTYRDIIMGV